MDIDSVPAVLDSAAMAVLLRPVSIAATDSTPAGNLTDGPASSRPPFNRNNLTSPVCQFAASTPAFSLPFKGNAQADEKRPPAASSIVCFAPSGPHKTVCAEP